ncbi:MAG: hypothetical protein N2746_03120 [Deltaproteobacteria bacterium]|nr:hypothetical protein [Deltaproteobacteria bacterium]
MEKEKSSNIEMLSEVIKNGVEAGLKIASKHYHMITDLQELLFEKDRVFRMLGEQVFQMIDQGRIFAPAIMQTTFKVAKEIIERISHLEEEKKRTSLEIAKDEKSDVKNKKSSTSKGVDKGPGVKKTFSDKRVVNRKSSVGKRPVALKKLVKKSSVKKKR